MSLPANALASSSSRPLRLEMRRDLTAKVQYFNGKKYYVVKEPIELKYFRFREEEFAILGYLDGQASLADIQQRFEREFAPQRISLTEIHHFVGTLHRSGLLISRSGQVQPLLERQAEKRRQRRWGALTNVLAVRWRGIDPQPILDRIYPYVAWYFSRAALLAVAGLGASALLLLLINFETFQARLPAFHEFFGPGNWLWLAATMAVVKVLHEFGHGLACRHFRCECHQMGFMMLVFTPALYCDVSDSWLLPNKWHRAAIGAAGIYVEVTLASLAALLWWFSEPGLLNHLCLRVMFICSAGTILFNGNPLMRFDGYYILSDLVEIPNLYQKARSILHNFLLQFCLGLPAPYDPYTPRRRTILALYSVASVVYRWIVTCSILLLLNRLFEPYGLKVVGQALALAALYGLVIHPLWRLYNLFRVPGRTSKVKRRRVIVASIALAALAAFTLVPLPHYIVCPLEVDGRDAAEVYVDEPGRLTEVFVQPGDCVLRGAPLARLDDAAGRREILRLEGLRDKYRMQRENLERESIFDPLLRSEVLGMEQLLATVEEQLTERRRKSDRLELTAPRDGIVYAAAARQSSDDETRLPVWSGLPTEPRNLGAYLTKREVFCRLGDSRRRKAMLVIDEHDVELVQPGQSVTVQFESHPWRSFTSRLTQVSRVEMQASPERLSIQAGGEVATRTNQRGKAQPLHVSYQGLVPLDDLDVQAPIGATGRAKIFTGWRPLSVRLWRTLAQTFHFEL